MAIEVLLEGAFCLSSLLGSAGGYARMLLLWSLLPIEEGRSGEICEEFDGYTLSMEDGMGAYYWATFSILPLLGYSFYAVFLPASSLKV
jgi:hypothetical protein